MDMDALMRAAGPMGNALKQADAERSATFFAGTAGGGAVRIRLSGALTVDQVVIAPAAAAAAGDDVSLLEDLVAAALGDALRQHRQRYGATGEEQMQKLMGSSGMAGLLGGLFGGGR